MSLTTPWHSPEPGIHQTRYHGFYIEIKRRPNGGGRYDVWINDVFQTDKGNLPSAKTWAIRAAEGRHTITRAAIEDGHTTLPAVREPDLELDDAITFEIRGRIPLGPGVALPDALAALRDALDYVRQVGDVECRYEAPPRGEL